MDPLLSRCDVPDALFGCDNDFGIPTLDIHMQAEYVHLPFAKWGTKARNQRMPGTYHFYTDDYKFEALWSNPTGIVNSACNAVVECNFSTGDQMPRIVGLHQIYRKRWLARYWQSQGVRVFVDLNVAPRFAEANLLGVPAGWRAYMTRGSAESLPVLDAEYAMAVERAGTSAIEFAVYGGGREVALCCQARGYNWIPEALDEMRGKRNG